MNRQVDPRTGYIIVAKRKFAEQGYHGVSLDALAREAGVTKQALLHFFGTKEKLYAEVLSDLAIRLSAEIDACKRPDPAEHLTVYFANFADSSLRRPDEARLVARALLDSDTRARTWPLKPYLDKLIALAGRTAGGQDRSDEDLLAWIIQLIGATQYLAIASPTVAGMYGKESAGTVATRFQQIVADRVQAFLEAAGPPPHLQTDQHRT